MHQERAHSKFSASGAERWFNCPGSVALSEGVPDKDSVWSKEGTQAHEILEKLFLLRMNAGCEKTAQELEKEVQLTTRVYSTVQAAEMLSHGKRTVEFIFRMLGDLKDGDLFIEQKVYLTHIHPEAFGTLDSSIVDHFGTLHVFDYKYGAGTPVSPKENLQMIFYALAKAHEHHYNFKRVRLWIIQPRIKGYDGPVFWDISMRELMDYNQKFQEAVDRVEKYPLQVVEGKWCHWCKAKAKCPAKEGIKIQKAQFIFSDAPLELERNVYGKSEADWKHKSKKVKSRKKEKEDFY